MPKYFGQGRNGYWMAALIIAGGALLSAHGQSGKSNSASGYLDVSDDAATITPKVKTAMGANRALNGTKINVSTNDNTVTLDGTTKNQTQSQIAIRIAQMQAPGYKIVNHLRVQSMEDEVAIAVDAAANNIASAANDTANEVANSVDDTANENDNAFSPAQMQLLPRIERALTNNAALHGSRITVSTRSSQNQITLSGLVKVAAQIQIASRIARDNAPGYAIINHLRVAAPQSTLRRTRHHKARAQTRKSRR